MEPATQLNITNPPSFQLETLKGGHVGRLTQAGESAPVPPLVSSAISHHGKNTHQLKVYKRDVKLTRSAPRPGRQDVHTPRGKVDSFSKKSRQRLRFTAANSDQPLVSQFCLTYHENIPTDGRTCKRHLDILLKFLRRQIQGLAYLWVLEFQKRGAPHFHLFLSIPPDRELQGKLASRWRQITGETEKHERFHAHEDNWISWEMGSGAYLCKYLDKAAQKDVPDNFQDVGRFWGCTRGMVTVHDVIDAATVADQDAHQTPQVDPQTGEITAPLKRFYQLRRTLKRYQYAQLRQRLSGKKLRIVSRRSTLVQGGACILPRLLEYYQSQVVPF